MWCNASVAEELYCKVERAFRCDAESCKEFKSQIFINFSISWYFEPVSENVNDIITASFFLISKFYFLYVEAKIDIRHNDQGQRNLE